MGANMLVIRELDMNRDTPRVEELERRCEAGSFGEMSIFTDLLGDPICRIRNSPSFLMLVSSVNSMYFCFYYNPTFYNRELLSIFFFGKYRELLSWSRVSHTHSG